MQIKTPPLVKSFAMPVDPAAFAGVPSVTALKPLAKANVLLAAGMDRRVVCCDLSAAPPAVAEENKDKPLPPVPATHLNWAHENWIHDLDIHPDGLRVATGGADRSIRIWKWGDERPLAQFQAHDEWVRCVAFSPDGRLLASAGDDRLAKLWDVETGRLVAALDGRSSFLDVLAWSVDSQRLLATGNDGKLYSWNVPEQSITGDVDVDNRREIEDEILNGGFSYPGGVRGLSASPDGKLVAAVGLKSLNVLDLSTGKEVLKQDGRGFGVAFDPTSRLLAFSQEKDILVWDFQASAVSHKIAVDQLGLFDMFFMDAGRKLVSGGCNGRVGIWDLAV